jgi:dolichol-phosphate mannosyltransferase
VAKLSVIIATYNEKANLGRVVEEIFRALDGSDFELVIVDDASPDGTGELADQLASKRPNIRVVHRPGKMGRGTAFVDGLKAAKGELLCLMDADLQHPPALLQTLRQKAEEGADVVIASRYVPGGDAEDRSRFRESVSKGALWLSHVLLPQMKGVHDTQSGYFLVKRHVIADAKLNVKGFTVLVEVLARGRYSTVVEVPYTFQARAGGESKLDSVEIIGYVQQLLRLSDYRVLKFAAVGASGLLVNNGVLWLLVSRVGVLPLLAAVFAIEASILSNFALNNVWTFRRKEHVHIAPKLLKYHSAVALGSLVNYGTLAILMGAGLYLLAANTVGIVLGFLLNYLLSEAFVWNRPQRAQAGMENPDFGEARPNSGEASSPGAPP